MHMRLDRHRTAEKRQRQGNRFALPERPFKVRQFDQEMIVWRPEWFLMEFRHSSSSDENLNAPTVLVKFLASLRPSYYIWMHIKRGLTRPANLPLAQGGYLERGMWPQRQC